MASSSLLFQGVNQIRLIDQSSNLYVIIEEALASGLTTKSGVDICDFYVGIQISLDPNSAECAGFFAHKCSDEPCP